MALGEMQDDWFAQFNPENASANTGINGGMSYTGGSPTFQEAGPVAGQPVSMEDFSRAWESSPYPGTVEGLKQFLASNPAYAASGITLGGSKGDKVYGPGGAYWGDAVIAAGDGGGKGKSALRGETGGAGGAMPFGSLLTPFGQQWSMPSAAEFMNMPGVQAALDASRQGVERSAAARGTLLTGGTGQAISNKAMETVGNLYLPFANLGLQGMDFNRGTLWGNQNNAFNKLFNTSQLGYNASSQPTVGPTLNQSSYQQPTATANPVLRPRK